MFKVRNYKSDELFDIAKFLDFKTDVHDVIGSPFLIKLKELPVASYYDVDKGYKEIDIISQEVYNSPFYAHHIMYYNDLLTETVPEGTVLRMFDLRDLNSLGYELVNGDVL
jgi:hypothetical protein